ncbi:RNA-binding protein [Xinfangfangia sp. D13-10-4-6]|uniref:RNA-binding protein n=1 Tax=Pseudogemmobacter hezensis TaxID=2737662 RepID=UPI0015522CC4|nr:RNA-binding protein [Pseudogemmobacter hezensis]NPD15384.1 RNA-binding protein [Pseudogemmobacter hezensis]
MTRGGRDKSEDESERKCIASGETGPKTGLVRFVVGPEGQIVPDILERLPGRGIWVSADRERLALAVKKGLFARAARTQVRAGAELPDTVEALLARRVIELLSLARKSGDAVTGYEKVKEWLVKGTARVLIQAEDGSERGKSKLRPPDGKNTLISWLTAGELGLAFGRERAIHAALAAGGLGPRIVEEAARLSGFRAQMGEPNGEQVGGAPAGKDM